MTDHTKSWSFWLGMWVGLTVGILVGVSAMVGQGVWEGGKYWGYMECQMENTND